MLKHFNITVYGRVQGVFFRTTTQEKAIGLGLTGFVKNMPDGTVYIGAEGEEEALKKLVAWCYRGSYGAKVVSVEVREGELERYEEFDIEY